MARYLGLFIIINWEQFLLINSCTGYNYILKWIIFWTGDGNRVLYRKIEILKITFKVSIIKNSEPIESEKKLRPESEK